MLYKYYTYVIVDKAKLHTGIIKVYRWQIMLKTYQEVIDRAKIEMNSNNPVVQTFRRIK